MKRTINTSILFFLLTTLLCVFILSPIFVFADEPNNESNWWNSENNNPTYPIYNSTQDKYYETLNDACSEATEDDLIKIVEDYECRNGLHIPTNVTIENEDKNATVYSCPVAGSYPSFGGVDNGVTFKGITFDAVEGMPYTSFYQINGTITFEDCDFLGLIYTFGNSSFINCSFSDSPDYDINCYAGDIYFEGCTFTSDKGRFILVYNEGYWVLSHVTVKSCNFINDSDRAVKSAVVVKATCIGYGVPLKYDVEIHTDCTLTGEFPENNRLQSKLVMIDDSNSFTVQIHTVDTEGNTTNIYPVDKNQYVEDVRVDETGKFISAIFNDDVIGCDWESVDESVCTVDEDGNFEKVSEGYCRIVIQDWSCLDESGNPMSQYFNVNFPHFFLELNGHGIGTVPEECFASPYEAQTIPTPWDDDYTFEGWYFDEDFKKPVDIDQPYKHTEDVTIYAKWKSNKSITKINLNQEDATERGTEVIYGIKDQGYYSDSGGALSITSIPKLPEKTGYEFMGYWTDDSSQYSQQIADMYGELETEYKWFSDQEEITIYAKWIEAPGPGPDPDPDPEPSPEFIDAGNNNIASGDILFIIIYVLSAILFVALSYVVIQKKKS